jgi:large repetitive protein
MADAMVGRPEIVPWRRVVAILVAVAALLTGLVVVLRADGFTSIDATVPRATRWFVHQATGRVVLADGFSGRALARLDVGAAGDVLEVAQGATGAAVIDRSAATARDIDGSALRIGPARSLGVVTSPSAIVGVGQSGLVAVDPASSDGLLLPPGGDAVQFAIDGAGSETRVAPDGSVWTIAAGALTRITTTGPTTHATGLSSARFSLVGSTPLLFDVERARVRLGDGDWVPLPAGVDRQQVVLQEPGPSADCGWLGADDELWCVGSGGVDERSSIGGLGVDGADRLAIAGDAGVLVRRAPQEIVRVDWRSSSFSEGDRTSVPADSELAVAASTDVIWIDQTNGALVWAVNPWGVEAIQKNDGSTPLLGETGEVVQDGTGQDVTRTAGGSAGAEVPFEPDGNGIDDPPVAVDDQVTARTGAPVPIVVTANDYDPDGEAIALVAVTDPSHGTVEIASATTAVYRPAGGFVGVDRFGYTIVDGAGTEASATVTVELLPLDATNRAPIGTEDVAETGPDAAVVIDVLFNDIDPERDSLRIDSFTPADVGGDLVEVIAPSGLPALRYTPPRGASGTATFTYRPADVLGAVGDPVPVRVEIAQPTDENRPPIVRPDAIRVRRDVPATLAVLANDRDPDGDRMFVSIVEPLPPGIDVRLDGNDLVITARAGAADLVPFAYRVDDGRGHQVLGSVLVALIGDDEPNRPPVANADTATVVVGTSRRIDVLANDTDPDGDALFLVAVRREAATTPGGDIRIEGDVVSYTPAAIVTDVDAVVDRFKYLVSDGNGHEVEGEVTVRVLPEPIAAPPYAQDDAATTFVDKPVTLDVLYNDGDPSGERPSIIGTPGCASGGTARVTAGARVEYVPPAGRSGVFTCTYEVGNTQGLSDSATIVITVLQPAIANLPPIVGDIRRTVEIGQTLVVDLLEDATDPDGRRDELRVLSTTTPVLGVAVREGSVVTFVAGDVTGTVSIAFQVGDARDGVTAARLNIRIVEPEPVPPIAVDDVLTITGPAAPVTFDVLANDSDPDGEVGDLRVVSATVESGDATAAIVGRSVRVTARPAFVGVVRVRYRIEDLDGLGDDAVATLTVLEAPNRAPTAVDDVGEVVNGGTVTVPIALNDFDLDGDPLTYSIVTPPDPALGTARLDAGSLVFAAVPGASGVATVTYRIDDGELTADAVVRITVLPCAAAPPEAPDVFLQTGYQQPIAVDLRSYARNGEVVSVSPPLSAPSGVITPPPGENGNIVITYAVRNSCRIQDVGQVVIDVNQVPAGTAFERSIGRREVLSIPVTALASDLEPLTIDALEQAPAWMTVAGDGRSIDVVPDGAAGRADTVAVISDPGGLRVRVPVTIVLVNLAPIAQPDAFEYTAGADTFAPLANDTDADGDAIQLLAVPGTLAFPNGIDGRIEVVDGDRLRIIPAGGEGVASFEYTIVDSQGSASAPAIVTVTVNRSPVAPDVEIELPAGTELEVPVPATDPDGDPLTLEVLDEPPWLELEVDGLVVTIRATERGPDRVVEVRYRVTDPDGASADGRLLVTITDPPPPPTTTTTTTTSTTTTTTTTTIP